jgi:hypothetical protein
MCPGGKLRDNPAIYSMNILVGYQVRKYITIPDYGYRCIIAG